jgi:hypothetical protein
MGALGLHPLTRPAALTASLLVAACATAASAASPPSFPPSIYPAARSFPAWGSSGGCASLTGLLPVGRGATGAVLPLLARYAHVSENVDLHLSDRANWPVVRETWSHHFKPPRPQPLPLVDVYGAPAARSPYAGLVRQWCGSRLLQLSWWIAACPREPYPATPCRLRWQNALTGHLFLINRRGHWLIWFTYP